MSIFNNVEMAEYRKDAAKRLQSEMKKKLLIVQKLVVERIIDGHNVCLDFSSASKGVSIHNFAGIDATTDFYSIQLTHYEWMSFYYDNKICEFYNEQLVVINHWIKLLKMNK